MDVNGTFQVERLNGAYVLTPVIHLSELEYDRIEKSGMTVLNHLAGVQAKNVIVDLANTNQCSSAALGFFIRLWKRLRVQDGQLVFCNVSPHVRDVLRFTLLDTLWPVLGAQQDALDAFGMEDERE